MLTVLLLIFLGQGLALGLHIGTWWLRQWAPVAMWIAGFFLLLVSFVPAGLLFIWTYHQDPSGMSTPAQIAVQYQRAWQFAAWAALFYGAVCLVGLYHSFLLKGRPRFWSGATCALWAEFGVAFVVWFLLDNLSGRWMGTEYRNYDLWPCSIFALTLIVLALFRPLALRVAREGLQWLQRKRLFARDSS